MLNRVSLLCVVPVLFAVDGSGSSIVQFGVEAQAHVVASEVFAGWPNDNLEQGAIVGNYVYGGGLIARINVFENMDALLRVSREVYVYDNDHFPIPTFKRKGGVLQSHVEPVVVSGFLGSGGSYVGTKVLEYDYNYEVCRNEHDILCDSYSGNGVVGFVGVRKERVVEYEGMDFVFSAEYFGSENKHNFTMGVGTVFAQL